MSVLPKSPYRTPEAYLIGENDRPEGIRYEYVNGWVYARVGASRNHDRVAMRFSTRLNLHLEDSPCEVFQADMKVGIRTEGETHFYWVLDTPTLAAGFEDDSDLL